MCDLCGANCRPKTDDDLVWRVCKECGTLLMYLEGVNDPRSDSGCATGMS